MPKLRRVTTKYVFDASDMPILRDRNRNKFTPKDVIVSHRTGHGFWDVRCFGYSTAPRHYPTEGIWVIDRDGRIVASNDYRIPRWLQDLVDQAVTMHTAGER